MSYGLDAVGNRTTQTEDDGSSTPVQTGYTYDALNRLTQVSYPALPNGPPVRTVSYSLDAVGNRQSDGTATYQYDAANRLVRVDKGGVSTTYSYDGRGNLVGETVNRAATEVIPDEAGGGRLPRQP